MDDKTAELRDIFIDATGSDTATESQEESPGSLTDESEVDTAERLPALIATMRERYEFDAGLDDAALERVVRGFFEGETDADLADALDVAAATVFDARTDLHLVREADRDAPFDLAELRAMAVEGVPLDERAERLDADEATVRRYGDVIDADQESTRANDRFRDGFAELLTDSDLSGRLASDAREDGLREATEDIETDVSF